MALALRCVWYLVDGTCPHIARRASQQWTTYCLPALVILALPPQGGSSECHPLLAVCKVRGHTVALGDCVHTGVRTCLPCLDLCAEFLSSMVPMCKLPRRVFNMPLPPPPPSICPGREPHSYFTKALTV